MKRIVTAIAAILFFVGLASAQQGINNPQTDASKLITGTLPNARLPSAIAVTTGAFGGCTIGTNSVCTSANIQAGSITFDAAGNTGLLAISNVLRFISGNGSYRMYLDGTNNLLQVSGFDAASPTAFSNTMQSVVGGTNNANGANWTFVGSKSTGSGTSGDIIFQTGVHPGAGSATTQATPTTALTIKGETLNVIAAADFQAATYHVGATAGVDCTGVTAGTVTVAKGIVTHC